MPLHMTLVTGAIKSNLLEIRDRTTSKIVEKHQGKLTQQSIRPLQENGMAAISKRGETGTGNEMFITPIEDVS